MTQNVIAAERVYNVKNGHMSWRVFITGIESEELKPIITFDPNKALRYMFLLKARSKKFIDSESIALLKLAASMRRETAKAEPAPEAEPEVAAPAEVVVAEEPQPAEEPVKKTRTRRAKKEEKVAA